LAEQLAHRFLVVEVAEGQTAGMEITALAECHHLFRERTDGFGFGKGGLDLLVLNEADNEVREERVAVVLTALKFDGFTTVSHESKWFVFS
jgi:hypothetical protein